MKRPMIHFLTALVTFFIGVAVRLVVTESLVPTPATSLQRVEPLAAPLPGPSAVDNSPNSSELILDYDPEEFNPRGDYFILGPKPKGLREFDCFELAVYENQGTALLTTKYFGKNPDYYITAGNGDYIITALVTKERLTFTATPKSQSEEDFEFRFDGHFLKGGVVSNARRNEAVLSGTLTKLKSGTKIAQSKVKFRVEYLGC